jgi:hypothetical protein
VLGEEGNEFAKLGIVQGNGVFAKFQAELLGAAFGFLGDLGRVLFAQSVQERLLKAQCGQVDFGFRQGHDLLGQQVIVPAGELGGLVVGQPVGADLVGGQIPGDVHRDLVDPQPNGGKVPGMTGDDDVVLVDHDGLPEAKLFDGFGDGINRGIRVPGVAIVGNDRFDGGEGGFHGKRGDLEEGKGGNVRVSHGFDCTEFFFRRQPTVSSFATSSSAVTERNWPEGPADPYAPDGNSRDTIHCENDKKAR